MNSRTSCINCVKLLATRRFKLNPLLFLTKLSTTNSKSNNKTRIKSTRKINRFPIRTWSGLETKWPSWTSISLIISSGGRPMVQSPQLPPKLRTSSSSSRSTLCNSKRPRWKRSATTSIPPLTAFRLASTTMSTWKPTQPLRSFTRSLKTVSDR